MKTNTQHLLRSFLLALLAVVAALLSMVAATFAWYIYNTSARTTRVEMAAGSSVTLQIANSADGPWGSSTVMEEFTGKLVPVSTDSILGGFQRVTGFETASTSGGASRLIANAFGSGVPSVHYYKTSLFLRSRSKDLNIYLSNIGFEDDSTEDPISTAMRLGLVVQGKEYIFEINQAHNPGADDNAAKEPEGGYVLLHNREDGSTVPFTPLNTDNFCIYDNATGTVTLKPSSTLLFRVPGSEGGYGEPVQVDVYLWLEGCDEDCTLNLATHTMRNIALSFSGLAVADEEA